MSVPRSVTKISRNGIEFTSNVDAVNYTMKELCRAALRDVGKLVCKRFKEGYYQTFTKLSGRVGKYTQYFVKHKYEDVPYVEIGLKPNGFYGGFQELGTSKMAKLGLLASAVESNIQEIRTIESKYLSALSSEVEAYALIADEDYEGGAEDG